MNLFQCKQQTTDGIDSLSDRQVTIILRRRRRRKEVSYDNTIHVIPNNSIKNDQRTISMIQLSYSREELFCLRREFAVLSKHYKKLTSRQYFNQDELLGLEDADMSRTRSNTRKAVLKLVLFEQERQRSFDTVDPIQIAKMLASHSILAHQEALERAAKCFLVATYGDKEFSVCSSSTEQDTTTTRSSQPSMTSKASSNEFSSLFVTHVRASNGIPSTITFKRELLMLPPPQPESRNCEQQKQNP